MTLTTPARFFLATVIAAGTAILMASLRTMILTPGASWLVLIGLAIVTGTCMMKLPRIETRFSLSDTLVFTSVLSFGPACAAVVAAVDALSASLRFNARDRLFALRTMFNMTAAAVSIWLPAHAFIAAGGSGLSAQLLILVGGYSLLNTGAIATVIALISRTSVVEVWRENFAWVWVAHAWGGLVAGAIAMYVPHVNLYSFVLILVVGAVGYATVRLYLGKVEESTGHLHKLNELYLATIKALAMAIDAKDQVTHGHIRRVQVYAVGLAKALGVSDQPTLKGIEAGALLHDTGKIAVPEHILNKPGKLNAQEYRAHEEPRHDRRGHSQRHRLPISGDSLRPTSSRELGRNRLSGSDRRRGDSSRGADSLGRGLLRCAHVGSALPARALHGGGARHPAGALGDDVRPAGGREIHRDSCGADRARRRRDAAGARFRPTPCPATRPRPIRPPPTSRCSRVSSRRG